MIIFPKVPIIFIFIYYVIIHLKIKIKYLLLFLLLIGWKYFFKINNYYEVYFLDINQGDCIIIVSPYQKDVVMIDTGGKISYSEESWKKSNKNYNLSDNVIKFLKSKGISKINWLILSHGDYDHMGEAINLVNNFKVEKIIFNCGELNDLEQDFLQLFINFIGCFSVGNNKFHI